MLPIGISAMAALLVLNAAVARTAAAEEWHITRVYDGDTFYVEVPDLPDEIGKIGVRIRGIDTPEIGGKAKCGWERRRGSEARARLVELLRSPIEYRDLKWDKYGGRVDATVIADGADVGKVLIEEGLARPYSGGKRRGWC